MIKLLGLTAAVLATCIAIVWFAPLPPSNYLGAIADKHRLLDTTSSPRLVFIGGSNLAFGLDGEIIHDALGCNVVNMALHAGFGLRYIMSEVKDKIKKGDIIILIHEYDLNLNGGEALLELVLYFPKGLVYMDFPDYVTLLKKFPVTLQRRFEGFIKNLLFNLKNSPTHSAYDKNNFDRYGDNIGHLGIPGKIPPGQQLNIPFKAKETVAAFNRFNADAMKKGARVFFSFPPCPKSYFAPKKAAARYLYSWLKHNLDFPVIGKPWDFVYPENYFFDTIYHLNKKGRYLRTIKLVEELGRVLQVNINPSLLKNSSSLEEEKPRYAESEEKILERDQR